MKIYIARNTEGTETKDDDCILEDYSIHSKEPMLNDDGLWEGEGKWAVNYDETQMECLGFPKLKYGDGPIEMEIEVTLLQKTEETKNNG